MKTEWTLPLTAVILIIAEISPLNTYIIGMVFTIVCVRLCLYEVIKEK